VAFPLRIATVPVALATALVQPCAAGQHVFNLVTFASSGSGSAAQPVVQPPDIDRLPVVADGVVLEALDRERPAFARCFVRAHDLDPTTGVIKAEVRVIVDADGAVRGVQTDLGNAKLAACLVNVARRLKFPAPGRMSVAKVAVVG
jgi:hypothetical protein